MTPLLENLTQVWKGVGLIQRVVLLAVLLACIGAVALLVGWARQPEMALLYSDLEPEQASKIVETVSDEGIPYELRAGGTSVYVPRQQVYSLRLRMASDGLPDGSHTGYRILDEEKMGASPFSQRVNFTRAVEGELARTIELMEGVSSARVHVVRPESPVFAGEQRQASATVAVRLHPGRQLTSGNVAAVVHLVAGSVEGLSPSNVVVVDAHGNLLTQDDDTGLARGANTLLDYQTQVESYLSGKAEDMLTTVLGPNRASVRVSASVNNSSVSETVESYDPEARVLAREEIESSQRRPGGEGGQGDGDSREENIVTEYKVGRTIREHNELPGRIESLSVAAFVDLSPPQAVDDYEGEGDAVAAEPLISLEDAEQVIRNALGLEPDAAIKVVNMPFHGRDEAEMLPPDDDPGMIPLILEIARRSSLGILVIGALVALKMFTGKSKSKTAALEGAGEQNQLPGDSEEDPEQLRRRITRALQDNPDEVKRLFLSWVKAEEGG